MMAIVVSHTSDASNIQLLSRHFKFFLAKIQHHLFEL